MIYDTRFGPFGSFAPGHTPFVRRSFGNQLLQVGGGQGHFLHPLRGDITRRGSFADRAPREYRPLSREGIRWLREHGASDQLLMAAAGIKADGRTDDTKAIKRLLATTASRRLGSSTDSSRR